MFAEDVVAQFHFSFYQIHYTREGSCVPEIFYIDLKILKRKLQMSVDKLFTSTFVVKTNYLLAGDHSKVFETKEILTMLSFEQNRFLLTYMKHIRQLRNSMVYKRL